MDAKQVLRRKDCRNSGWRKRRRGPLCNQGAMPQHPRRSREPRRAGSVSREVPRVAGMPAAGRLPENRASALSRRGRHAAVAGEEGSAGDLADAQAEMNRILVIIVLLAVAAFPSTHRRSYPRSRKVTSAFQRAHPCPSTGKKYGACPGYVKNHRTPLCAGGSDTPSNLEWQTTAEGKATDKVE